MDIVALTPLILGLAGLYAKTRRNGKKLDTIHILVNSRLQNTLKQLEHLEELLREEKKKNHESS